MPSDDSCPEANRPAGDGKLQKALGKSSSGWAVEGSEPWKIVEVLEGDEGTDVESVNKVGVLVAELRGEGRYAEQAPKLAGELLVDLGMKGMKALP